MKQGKTPTVDSYVVPEGHICFYSTPVITSFLKKANFSKVVAFEPKVYRKSGRAFKSLKRLKLIKGIGDRPENIFEKALYYSALRAMRLLGIRQRPLPVGIK